MTQALHNIDKIVKEKVHSKVNHKTYQDMKNALDDIKKSESLDRKLALIGTLILIPIIYILSDIYF